MSNSVKLEPQYIYRATVLRVIDADTFDCKIDLGFNTSIQTHIRLLGIDAPEVRRSDKVNKEHKAHGLEAKQFVIDEIEGKEVLIESVRRGKYRYVASVQYLRSNNQNEKSENQLQSVSLKDVLIENGFKKDLSLYTQETT